MSSSTFLRIRAERGFSFFGYDPLCPLKLTPNPFASPMSLAQSPMFPKQGTGWLPAVTGEPD